MKNKNRKLLPLCLAVLTAVLLITAGCSSETDPAGSSGSSSSGSGSIEITGNGDDSYSCSLFAMDTVMQLKVYGDKKTSHKALRDAAAEITRLDDELDVTNENSPVYALNQRTLDTVSGDTAEVLEESIRMAGLTEGKFDPTIYPVVRAWGFTTEEYRVPDTPEIEELLTHVGYSRITASRTSDDSLQIIFDDDKMEIDTGGIGKGYTSEMIYNIMKKDGIDSAVVSLGGNVMTLGEKPGGNQWNVAVEDPFHSGGSEYAGILHLTDKFAITSGGYQRFFEENGKTYIHIMDPSTGCPVDNDLSSVTIITDSGTEGDALSTALYVMGLEKAVEYWKTSELDFDIVLITTDRKIYLSEGIAGSFETDSDDYTDIRTVSK